MPDAKDEGHAYVTAYAPNKGTHVLGVHPVIQIHTHVSVARLYRP